MRVAGVLAVLALALGAPARGDDAATRAARAYTLVPRAPPPLAPGERGAVAVAIRCEPGVHVQRQAPLRATASASGGLVLAAVRLGWSDVRGTPDTPELELGIAGSAPGAGEVRLQLEFFVCSKEWCVRQAREVVIPVVVGAPATQGPAGSPAAGPGPR